MLNNRGMEAIGIGFGSMFANGGDYNIGIGSNALANSPLPYNVGVGFNAGYLSQGENGVFIGASAGDSNQGDFVVAIGNSAGQNNGLNGAFILSNLVIRSHSDKATADSFYARNTLSTGDTYLYYDESDSTIKGYRN